MATTMKSPNELSIPAATETESKDAFDYTSRYYTGMSGEEFLQRLDECKLDPNSSQIQPVLTMLPFVR